MSDCHDCGRCYWTGCEREADFTVRGVTIKKSGSNLFMGNIDLCAGHYRWTERTGRLNLDWTRVEKVMAQ